MIHKGICERGKVFSDAGREFGVEMAFPAFDNPSDFNVYQTIDAMEKALFVLVDLTLERPSCYYELALAELKAAHVYRVAAEGTPIHLTTAPETVTFCSGLKLHQHIRELLRRHVP